MGNREQWVGRDVSRETKGRGSRQRQKQKQRDGERGIWSRWNLRRGSKSELQAGNTKKCRTSTVHAQLMGN